MNVPEKRKCVLVLGMHRSGTSAVTAGLQALGVHLGDKSDYANQENPKGFFENQDVIRLNEEILEYLGLSWNNPFVSGFDFRARSLGKFHRTAVNIIEEKIHNLSLWGLKDPRICLLLPFWRKVIAGSLRCEIVNVHVLRNPLEVAGSLRVRARHFKQFYCGEVHQTLLLWFAYHYHALSGINSDRNILVSFDQLIQDPTGQLHRLANFLGIEAENCHIQNYAESFLEKGLKHHAVPAAALRHQGDDFFFVADFYEQLVNLTNFPSFNHRVIQKILSSIPDLDFYRACCQVAGKVFQDAAKVNIIEHDRENLKNAMSDQESQIRELKKVVPDQESQIRELKKVVSDQESQIRELHRGLSERNERLRDITSILEKRQKHIRELVRRSETCDNQLKVLKNNILSLRKLVSDKDVLYKELLEKYQHAAFNLPCIVVRKTTLLLETFIPFGKEYFVKKISDAVRQRREKKTIRLISQSGQFDEKFYCSAYPDIEKYGLDPIAHFVRYGVLKGYMPNAHFDPFFYQTTYLDVGISGLNPFLHYILFGKARHYRTQEKIPPQAGMASLRKDSCKFSVTELDRQLFDPLDLLPNVVVAGHLELMESSRETVLVVCHEASRTGAPILGYNLVDKLLQKYNVVALFLGPGPIAEACQKKGAVSIVTPKEYCWNTNLTKTLVDALLDTVKLKFAVVNSIESRAVLALLGKAYIATVCLIHEFAVYTRPVDSFRETILWSGVVVFSSRLTYDNMVSEYPYLGEQKYEILPQGRCEVPTVKRSGKDVVKTVLSSVSKHAVHVLRPANFLPDGIVVLGAGFVQIRKGVDLFIACAAKVIADFPEISFRFVWVGKGYDPVGNLAYSVYLADQVARSGLEESVFFMDEVEDIEAVYAQADIMLLSSRLDPLPNVAIDAFFHGLPVVCFSQATGIAEILDNFALHEYCVANYLDIIDMAAKVGRLAESKNLRTRVAELARHQADQIFCMDRYVDQLVSFAHEEAKRAEQEEKDVKIIEASALLDRDFFGPALPEDQTDEDIIRYYVRSWASGVLPRKLFPGFHPGIYREQHGTTVPGGDPLADYISEGQPSGPWDFAVISPDGQLTPPVDDDLHVGLHIHAYYPELLPDLLNRLKMNKVRVDLLVSVTTEEGHAESLEILEQYKFPHKVLLVPNRGRDIGPFLTGFGEMIADKYTIIGHMHTKKSLDCDEEMGKVWYTFLLETLIGGRAPMADIIIEKMASEPELGLVFPCDPNVVSWDANYSIAEELVNVWGVETLPQAFEMPVGNMFWIETSLLRKVLDMNLQWNDYPTEPLPYDGTLLHALERSWGFLAKTAGNRVALSYVPGVSR